MAISRSNSQEKIANIFFLEILEFRKIDITCHKFIIDINIGEIKASALEIMASNY